MLRLLVEAFFVSGHPSFALFEEILDEPSTWRAFAHTLETGLGGTAIALVVGGAMGLLVALTDIRAKGTLIFCFMLPLMIPPQVTALSWIRLAEPGGPVLSLLGAQTWLSSNPIYSPGGIMLVLGLHGAPLVFLALRAALRDVPRELVEAGQAAGARRLRVLGEVVLPLMTPALVAGAALAFISSIGNFGIPAFLGIPIRYSVLTTLIYRELSGFGPSVLGEVAVLSVLLAVLAMGGIAVQNWLLGRRDYRTTGATATLLPYALGGARPWTEAACWILIVLMMVLPLVALAATSLVSAYGLDLTWATATLDHYRYVLFEDSTTQRSFVNSFILGGATAATLAVIASLFAYFLVWRPNPVLRALNFCVELPYALPGTVVAIACILLFVRPLPLIGVSIYNTLWIIFAGYLIHFITRAVRPVVSALYSVDQALEEAGAMCGARMPYRLATIVLPLMAPTVFAAAMIVFLTSYNELTVSVLLWSVGAETVGVLMFSLEEAGDKLEASAVAMLTVCLTVVLMTMLSAIGRYMPKGVIPWRD